MLNDSTVIYIDVQYTQNTQKYCQCEYSHKRNLAIKPVCVGGGGKATMGISNFNLRMRQVGEWGGGQFFWTSP